MEGIIMVRDDFYRLELLLVKVHDHTANMRELKELSSILDDWDNSPNQEVQETFLKHQSCKRSY